MSFADFKVECCHEIVTADQLNTGDVVVTMFDGSVTERTGTFGIELVKAMQKDPTLFRRTSSWDTSIVENVIRNADGSVHHVKLFRPYGHRSSHTSTSGVITYTGHEFFVYHNGHECPILRLERAVPIPQPSE